MPFGKQIIQLNSLSVKILAAYVAGMILSITLLVASVALAVHGDFLARMDLADLAQDMTDRIKFDGSGNPTGFVVDMDNFEWVYDSLQRETAYRILDASGNVALLSPAGEKFWPVTDDLLRLARGRFAYKQGGATFLGATEPFIHGGKQWYLQIAASTQLMTLLHRVAMPLVGAGILLFGVITLFAFGLCVYFTLRYALKPLREVSASASAISPRSIHERLKVDAVPSELVPIVESFNRVLERLETGYRLQQEFLGNAAHELKTPLALIRAQVELREGGDAHDDALLGDVEYMTRQVRKSTPELASYGFSMPAPRAD